MAGAATSTKKKLNIPVKIGEVAQAMEPGDQRLLPSELATLTYFRSVEEMIEAAKARGETKKLGKLPKFKLLPGATQLRKCSRGRVLVKQGDSGATAFLILRTEDVIGLRKHHVETIKQILSSRDQAKGVHVWLEQKSDEVLQRLQNEYSREVQQLEVRLEQNRTRAIPDDKRQVATAHLFVDLSDRPRGGLRNRLRRLIFGDDGYQKKKAEFIPVDGPSDISTETLQAPLHENEVFGEMSCLNRSPRSATVIADEDCYMLEMLRNVLDALQSVPEYRKQLNAIYRARVLDGHIRQLTIFRDLPADELNAIKEKIDLVDFEAGQVIFEEHEPSDCLYVVRSGLVKVVANAWTILRYEEFQERHWNAIARELVHSANDDQLGSIVWSLLPEAMQITLRSHVGGGTERKDSTDDQSGNERSQSNVESSSKTVHVVLDHKLRQDLIDTFNLIIRDGASHTALGETKEEAFAAVGNKQLNFDCDRFPEYTESWSELERRTFHRSLLEAACEDGIPRRAATSGPRRTLSYTDRGESFGELGVITQSPRSATVVAYDHPDGESSQLIPDGSRVELVRIAADEFREILVRAPTLRDRVETIAQRYQKEEQQRSNQDSPDQVPPRSQSQEFEQLGLIQGQRLMLIDLDRCTRCNQCVEACVSSHNDGHTRLYLDGPRFEKYLVPLTCRSCLDPVCMIGCPVGAINRGDNGEIQITNWCIGCERCAKQCPYGSIQMNRLADNVELSESQRALLADADHVSVSEQAVVCDLCSSLPSQKPSCVHACPHDAALRVNSQEFFFN